MKIALLGNITLDFFARDFQRMGHDVYVPPGFDTWRQEILAPESGLHRFAAEAALLILPDQDILKISTGPDAIKNLACSTSDVHTINLSALADETPGFWDDRMRQLAAMPFSLAGLRSIEDEFLFWTETIPSPRKILAVDADNTLWKGIVSEDGPLSVTPYTDFQRGLIALKSKGVLLVLLSKNDPLSSDDAPVANVLARADMPLSANDFAATGVNWGPKAGNLLKICVTLNLSPDSVVFVDDNPYERVQMKAHLPEVVVSTFPSDMSHPAPFLRRLETAFFSSFGGTNEDLNRTAMYRAEAARNASAGNHASLDAYLDSLGMRCKAGIATPNDIPRLAQMAGKTNQFNATTIRRSANELLRIVEDPKYRVWTFRLTDNFGDMGLVCYIIYSLEAGRITDFVMSCRAMGRTLENFALGHVRRALDEESLSFRGIDYVQTQKNAPFRAFLDSLDGKEATCTHVASAQAD